MSLGATGGESLVDNIVEKVVSRLSGMNVAGTSGDTSVDYVQRQSQGSRSRGRNRANQRGRGSNRGGGISSVVTVVVRTMVMQNVRHDSVKRVEVEVTMDGVGTVPTSDYASMTDRTDQLPTPRNC